MLGFTFFMGMIETFRTLEKNGFKLIPYQITKSEEEAATAAKKLGYPIAMKIISPDIEHKSDVGGVKVDIKTEEMLRLTYRSLMQVAGSKKVDGILIQKMARKGIELIIGGKKDPQFGPMIILGLGGIYVEIFRDVSARICPLVREDVDEMLSELKSHPLLMGARGQKPIDKKMLEDLVLRTSEFMIKENIVELDLNPVICNETGCDIVDARFTK